MHNNGTHHDVFYMYMMYYDHIHSPLSSYPPLSPTEPFHLSSVFMSHFCDTVSLIGAPYRSITEVQAVYQGLH